MNLKPVLPKVRWPELILHIPSMVLQYGIWIIGLQVALRFGHGIVVQMFEYIPDAEVTYGIVVAIVALVALLAIFSQFVSNKKAEAVAKKEAKQAGEEYDEVNGKISANLYWGYPVIALISAVIVATVVMLAVNEVEASAYAEYVSTQTRAVMIGAVASFICFAIVDKYLIRSAMDGLFFEKVEEKAINDFLADGIEGLQDKVAEVKSAAEKLQAYLDAGFTKEEALAEMKKDQ